MKKIVITFTIAFAACTFAVAQSNSTPEATKATPVVNAADASENTKAESCTPEMMKACGSTAEASSAKSKSCCSSSASADAKATPASSLSKEGDQAKTVTIGMSAKKPEKKD